jgi:DNA gyrase subunit B
MPPLIEHVDEDGEKHGYLYIAQSPLYKAKRGKSEVYLKDDRAMEEYLLETALEDTVFETFDGTQYAGGDLKEKVLNARHVKGLLETLMRHVGNGDVIEQAAIAGALNPEMLDDREKAQEAADYIARRLDALADEYEKGWTGTALEDGGLEFSRVLRGVTETRRIDAAIIKSAEARRIDGYAADLQALFAKHGTLRHGKDETKKIHGPRDLFDMVMAIGRKGVTVQRYKGLGEMNPEQLWSTTLDPEARTLLQVKIDHADEAGEIFATLMGDVVEPRRNFIQEHALEVANLDI